ncbi:MAG: mandelate racemase/muconate lactonizing enzyme family protein [Planctomycetota bacterium]|nr:mandelate racemase/muconate lactonizing enzyme family protein [Planctomycetota bacterium]
MANPSDITVHEVSNSTRNFVYRQPMKFGGRVVEDVCVLRTEVTVTRAATKKKVKGIGEMTMGNAWAWPSKIPGKITLRLMNELANRVAARAQEADLQGDPLQISHRIKDIRNAVVSEMQVEYKIQEPIPELAGMVATSPLDAAIHDAYGRALGANSFQCMTADYLNEDLSAYLGDEFVGKYPGDYLSDAPKSTMPLYHLVGALDPLSKDDQQEVLNDGYPETLEEWLHKDGVTHLKIKLAGNNIDWDVGRIVEVTRICERVASERNWKLSFDFNEQCPNEDYVLDLLERIERLSKPSFDRLQYIEQPTPRDLTQRTEMTVHRIARIRPVVIDESLTGAESLKLARQRGYTGLALKACKGQSESLIMGSAGAEYSMFTCVQDLTCIGASFLHSAAVAARFPKVAAIEGNGRQYCPIGNEAYMKDYAPMFRVRYGTVPTELLDGPGLGFDWKPLGEDDPQSEE